MWFLADRDFWLTAATLSGVAAWVALVCLCVKADASRLWAVLLLISTLTFYAVAGFDERAKGSSNAPARPCRNLAGVPLADMDSSQMARREKTVTINKRAIETSNLIHEYLCK